MSSLYITISTTVGCLYTVIVTQSVLCCSESAASRIVKLSAAVGGGDRPDDAHLPHAAHLVLAVYKATVQVQLPAGAGHVLGLHHGTVQVPLPAGAGHVLGLHHGTAQHHTYMVPTSTSTHVTPYCRQTTGAAAGHRLGNSSLVRRWQLQQTGPTTITSISRS